jgi:hypothetical protein
MADDAGIDFLLPIDEFEMFGVKQRDHVFRASQQFFNQPCSRCR